MRIWTLYWPMISTCLNLHCWANLNLILDRHIKPASAEIPFQKGSTEIGLNIAAFRLWRSQKSWKPSFTSPKNFPSSSARRATWVGRRKVPALSHCHFCPLHHFFSPYPISQVLAFYLPPLFSTAMGNWICQVTSRFTVVARRKGKGWRVGWSWRKKVRAMDWMDKNIRT